MVLSDRERETLREVQCQFVTEDPGFVRSFGAVRRRHSYYSLQWVYAMPRWAYTAVLVAAVALGVLMLLAHAPGTAVVFAALATLIAVVRRHQDEAGRRIR